MNAPDGISLRAADATDVPFIRDSWVRSYVAANKRDALQDARATRDRATRLLQRSHALVLVDAEDPTHVAGYCVHERPDGAKPVLHYVYVKHPLRRLGLGGLLLHACGFTAGGYYTHHTDALEPLAQRYRLLF